jgi:two-component system NtrC family sensor kinase
VDSLKTGILAQLTFLILAAMLLINVVMIKLAEKDLIGARLQSGGLLTRALEQSFAYHFLDAAKKSPSADTATSFHTSVHRLLNEAGFSNALIVDREGNNIFATGLAGEAEVYAQSGAREAAATGLSSHHFTGTTWGVIWLSKSDLWIFAPLSFEGRLQGGMSLSCSLVPLYETLRDSEKVILLYIFLDTLILVMVGLVLLSRIVVKPIHQLLRLTAGYKDGDAVPAMAEASRNEIGELSRSLQNMLRRLEENKKELRNHIASLEKANNELRQAQDEIMRSEKLASVGRLAAGVAHEIGNPIGIILGYLDLLHSGDTTEEEKRDFLGRIESEITRVNRIIRELLDFSRPSSGELIRTHVHEALRNTMSMLEHQPMMEDVITRLELTARHDVVLADPNRLQQVFLNLIMNSADALSVGGERGGTKMLTIRSENRDEHIRLAFSDNGPGIPKAELTRIFDPFYTTKEPGKGTGLGLSVCYRIVESLGGTIKAESAVGQGTTVMVIIPHVREQQEEKKE